MAVVVGLSAGQEAIIREGKLLYGLERAAWRATDRMIVNQGKRRDSVGGYTAYRDGENFRVVTFSRFDTTRILQTFVMNREFDEGSMLVDTIGRRATPREQQLIDLRLKVVRMIASDSTHMFKRYRNTHYNVVPIADDTSQRVYVMTTIEQGVVMPIGNDHLFRFSPSMDVIEHRRLHASFLPFDLLHRDTSSVDPDVTWHRHADSGDPYATATDVCAVLLYMSNSAWTKHAILTRERTVLFDRKTGVFDELPVQGR